MLEGNEIHHLKGILLYGLTSTGKILISRTLAKALNAHQFKALSNPELFDKYIEKQKKIMELIANIEIDKKENDDEAGLLVIIFDEIDSICKVKGIVSSGTGENHSAVNQL